VTLTCKDNDGTIFEVNYEWMVSYYPPHFTVNPDKMLESSLFYGCDYDTLAVNNVKKGFYVAGGEKGKSRPKPEGWIWPPNDNPMRGRTVETEDGNLAGYIRIFSFATPDENEFVNDFLSILDNLKEKDIVGLIIDIRGNGGGLITACELLLAKLSGKKFKAQSFQFLCSGVTLDLTTRHSGRAGKIDLNPWKHSLINSKSTGETYSLGIPICKFPESLHQKREFTKPLVLITDALCYSAADMFAAGFQDLKLGKILGIHGNTGAGGANVWRHNQISDLWSHNREENDLFFTLPAGTDITVAVRRTLRANGYPLEDIGVIPDVQYKMTDKDITENNFNLITKAIQELRSIS
jgi:hypothetical protein